MKNILITGANSYIGTSLERWLGRDAFQGNYRVDTLDMQRPEWKEHDFSGIDVVFHVAGIAHVEAKAGMEELYYKVNCDLAINTAKKAKEDGVGQFLFMSSIMVYGDSSSFGQKKVITKDTLPKPANFYGDSKLQAEKGIVSLQDEHFHVVILRPPMIYGKGSKGNYQKLAKLARMCPVFPDIDNQRSMLYVDNLCECIRFLIDEDESGFFYPQNKEYVKTTEMVQEIAEVYKKNIWVTRVFNGIIKQMEKKSTLIDKVFGSLVYDKELSNYKNNTYCIVDFKDSIQITEGN